MKSPCVALTIVVLVLSDRTRSSVWPLLCVGKFTWFLRLKRSKKSLKVSASTVSHRSALMLKYPRINSSFDEMTVLSMRHCLGLQRMSAHFLLGSNITGIDQAVSDLI